MELIASLNSALLLLSILHVSIHTNPRSGLRLRICAQQSTIFAYPILSAIAPRATNMSSNSISSSPHVCDRIAYLGMRPGKNVSNSSVWTLTSLIVMAQALVPRCTHTRPAEYVYRARQRLFGYSVDVLFRRVSSIFMSREFMLDDCKYRLYSERTLSRAIGDDTLCCRRYRKR